MPLATTCACGKSLRVPESFAGGTVRCPACREWCLVLSAAEQEQREDEAVEFLLAAPSQPALRAEVNGQARPNQRTPLPQHSYRGPRRLKMQWQRKEKSESSTVRAATGPEEDLFGRINPFAIGGILTMVLGLGWFASGHAAGYLFVGPPVLLALGAVAAIKGLCGSE